MSNQNPCFRIGTTQDSQGGKRGNWASLKKIDILSTCQLFPGDYFRKYSFFASKRAKRRHRTVAMHTGTGG
jgi:hypothetical protein